MIGLLLKGASVTIQISLMAILIGLGLGTCMGVLSSRAFGLRWMQWLIGGYVALMRGTPLFVQLLIAYFAIPEVLGINLSPWVAGVATLGLNSTAYLCETVRAGLDSLPLGQREAARSLGYTPFQSLRFILLPQAIRRVLPAITNEVLTLIKESSILMVIGVPELTKVSKELVARELRPMEIYLMAAGFYLCMTGVVGWVLKRTERACYVTH